VYKELFAAVAIVLTFVAFVPYVVSIRAGRTKPHAFSWMVWGLGTFVVFLAQLADRGGSGAWPTGVSGIITACIAVLAYKLRSDTSITKVDWIFLMIALAALPCWLLTSNPLIAVVLLTGMDLAGFVPTFRFAFLRPHEEHIGFYSLGAVRNAVAIAALEHYSWTTVLFPAAVGIACALFVAMVASRRTHLRGRDERRGRASEAGS
jgi:hypothetical protein